MKKKLIVAVLSVGIAVFLGLKSELTAPIIEAVYCKVFPADCE